jgi:hypothetical protein
MFIENQRLEKPTSGLRHEPPANERVCFLDEVPNGIAVKRAAAVK